ncbi:hypothetical protein ACA910_010888 [Epithemia clementina (nom. ined.)]
MISPITAAYLVLVLAGCSSSTNATTAYSSPSEQEEDPNTPMLNSQELDRQRRVSVRFLDRNTGRLHHQYSVAGPDGCVFNVPPNRNGGGKSGGKKGKQHMPSGGRFDSMVVFGDSLSDIGTRKFFSPCNQPSSVTMVYCNNPRTSDGPLLVDYLAAHFNVGPLQVGFPDEAGAQTPVGGSNFARSGATGRNALAETDTAPHFSEQVQNYKAATGQVTVPGFHPNLDPPTKRRLHVVWFGSNDVQDAVVTYVNNAVSTPSSLTPQVLLQAGLAGVQAQLNNLLAMPNVCNMLVLGPFDVSLTPSLNLLGPIYAAAANLEILRFSRAYTESFNDQLQALIATSFVTPFQEKCSDNRHHGFGIQFVHTVDFMDVAFPNYSEGDATRSCNARFRTSGSTCLATPGPPFFVPIDIVNNTDGICSNPVAPNLGLECDCRGYLFYDEIHLSSEFHQKFFQSVLVNSLQQN